MENNLVKDPLFSIIVPVYNSERFLKKCIGSLLAQNFPDFEILIVNDGSTDSSGNICDEYAMKDRRIRVFHQRNKGVSAARNLALKEARGKYINFVDSDDWVTEDYLETYVMARSDYDYDLVYTEMVRELDDKKNYRYLADKSVRQKDGLSEILAFLLECGEYGYACNKSFKKELLVSYSITFNEQIPLYEDALLTTDYCLKINSIRLFPKGVYHYYIVKSSFTHVQRLDYPIYHLATTLGVERLELLADRLNSVLFEKAVNRFCQKWEQTVVLYMYLHGENLSRKARLSYLKEFHHLFDTADPFIKIGRIRGRLISWGMTLKNDKIKDLFFCHVRLIYKLKLYFSKQR